VTEGDDALGAILADEGHKNGVGNYDYEIKAHRGNVAATLIEGWLNGGTLFGREQEFMEVLRLAGFDTDKISYHDPYAQNPAVYPVYLSIQNPLDTAAISDETMAALEAASKRARLKKSNEVDTWDKNSISPKEWMAKLREDVEKGTTFAWTQIPDWVTKTLKNLAMTALRIVEGNIANLTIIPCGFPSNPLR
jgi:hypothetical protein